MTLKCDLKIDLMFESHNVKFFLLASHRRTLLPAAVLVSRDDFVKSG